MERFLLSTKRLCFLAFAVLAVASLLGCRETPGRSTPPAKGANIVFIVVDTLRADHLGAYGQVRETSPRIDAFARDAVLFRHAYTPRPKTTPAMASLFTSSPPHVHGVRSIPQSLPDSVLYLPEEIHKHGYTTAAVVSNPATGEDFGFRRGFDVWSEGKSIGGSVTSKGIEILNDLQGEAGRPFFLWLHYGEPHAPYKPAPEYHEMFVGDSLWAEEDVPFSDLEFDSYRKLPQIVNLQGITNPYYYIAEYDAEVRTVDSEIGRLLDELQARGLYDSSLIVLTADHGESLGEHGYYFEHGMFPYDATGHIPLVIRYPGLEPAVTDVPASLVDVMPTLLRLVGIPVPKEAMGVDLFSMIEANETDRPIFAESGYQEEPQVSVRRGGWKLIYVPSRSDRRILTGGKYELYNTTDDPLEERNLAGQGLEVETELAELLTDWLDSWDDYKLPDASEDTISPDTWKQLQALGYVQGEERTLDFLENLERAKVTAPEENYVKATEFSVGGESRPVLFQHPDSTVTFHSLRLSRRSRLEFGVGISQEVWSNGGDGVLFEIAVVEIESGEETAVYSRYVDPKNRPGDRMWIDESVDLGTFADRLISIRFQTSSGPAGNNDYDWAGWSSPKLRR